MIMFFILFLVINFIYRKIFILRKLSKQYLWHGNIIENVLVAEGTGLEPVDQYYRSRISNPLHYRSANPPQRMGQLYRKQIYISTIIFVIFLFI